MIRSKLKFYAIQRLSFYIGIAAVSLVSLFISSTLSIRVEGQKKLATESINEIKDQSNALNVLLIKSQSDVNAWNEKIKDIYIERNGLDLDIAKKKIEALRTLNHIRNLSINLTNPRARDDITQLKFEKLIHSRMTITLQASSDRDVLRFVSSISADIPGVLKFINMDMVSEADKGSDKVINARIELQWQNVEDAS